MYEEKKKNGLGHKRKEKCYQVYQEVCKPQAVRPYYIGGLTLTLTIEFKNVTTIII
jgi:hypothetical protein